MAHQIELERPDKVKKWSDCIDFRAVDWNYQGDTFHNEWQTYRTRKSPTLRLISDPHSYTQAGCYHILVKVIDIFGNDTTELLDGGDGVKEIMLAINIKAIPEGGFIATSEELPGLVAQGRTVAETMEIAQDVARKLLESYHEHGDKIPAVLRAAAPAEGEVRIPITMS